jgi:hypothetical protein
MEVGRGGLVLAEVAGVSSSLQGGLLSRLLPELRGGSIELRGDVVLAVRVLKLLGKSLELGQLLLMVGCEGLLGLGSLLLGLLLLLLAELVEGSLGGVDRLGDRAGNGVMCGGSLNSRGL